MARGNGNQSGKKKCRHCRPSAKPFKDLVGHIIRQHPQKIKDEIVEVLDHYSHEKDLKLPEALVERGTSICMVKWNGEEVAVHVSSKSICTLSKFKEYVAKFNQGECPDFDEADVNEFMNDLKLQDNDLENNDENQSQHSEERDDGDERTRSLSSEPDDVAVVDMEQSLHDVSVQSQTGSGDTTALDDLLSQEMNFKGTDQMDEEITVSKRRNKFSGQKSNPRRRQPKITLATAVASLDDILLSETSADESDDNAPPIEPTFVIVNAADNSKSSSTIDPKKNLAVSSNTRSKTAQQQQSQPKSNSTNASENDQLQTDKPQLTEPSATEDGASVLQNRGDQGQNASSSERQPTTTKDADTITSPSATSSQSVSSNATTVPQEPLSPIDGITGLMNDMELQRRTFGQGNPNPPVYVPSRQPSVAPTKPPAAAFEQYANVSQSGLFDNTNQQPTLIKRVQPKTSGSIQLVPSSSNTTLPSAASSQSNIYQVPKESLSELDQISRLMDDPIRLIDDEAFKDLQHVLIGDYKEYKKLPSELSLFYPRPPVTFTKCDELFFFVENGGTPLEYFFKFPFVNTVQTIFSNGFYFSPSDISTSLFKIGNQNCFSVVEYISWWKEQISNFAFLKCSDCMATEKREVLIRSFSSNVSCAPFSPSFKEVNFSFHGHKVTRASLLPGTNFEVKTLLMIFVARYGNVSSADQTLKIQTFDFKRDTLNTILSPLKVYDAFQNEIFELQFYRNLNNTVFLYQFPDRLNPGVDLNVRFSIDFSTFGAVKDGSCIFGQIVNSLSVFS